MFIRRTWSLQDGDTLSGSPPGVKVDTSLGTSGIIYLEESAIASIYIVGTITAQTVTFYGCNDPAGANNTFVPLYDETGAAVTLSFPTTGIIAMPPAAMCCRAIKLVAGTGAFFVTIGRKG